jgi:hypothetical protein
MRADDAFWAARIVARFSNDAIRVIVDRARYSDPHAADYVTGTIIKRRDKVVAYWLTQVNPLVDFALGPSGELTFANAAEQAGVAATTADSYRVQWATFDNATGIASDVGGEISAADPRTQAPASLLASKAEYVEVRVAAVHPRFPVWAKPVTVRFRRDRAGWKLVGVLRLPDESQPVPRLAKK